MMNRQVNRYRQAKCERVLKISGEPESPNEGGVFIKIYDEPLSPKGGGGVF